MKYTIAKMFQILRHNRWVSILMIIEIALGMSVFTYSLNMFFSLSREKENQKNQERDLVLEISGGEGMNDIEKQAFTLKDYEKVDEITDGQTFLYVVLPQFYSYKNENYEFVMILVDYKKLDLKNGYTYWGNGLQDIMNCEMNPIPQLEKKQMPTKIAELNWKTETDEIKLKKCVVAPITYMEQYKEEISSAAIHVEWKKKYLKNEEKTIQKIETYLYNSHDQSFRYRIYSPEIELRNNTIKVMTSLQAINKVALLFMAVFLTGVFLILLVWMDGRNLSTLISKSEYNEKRPVGKKWILMVLIGIGVLVLGENQYQGSDLSYMYSHVIFIVGLFLVAAFGVALILEGLKHRKQFYHRHILQMNQLYSKYMNNLLILLILLVIHFFALTYLTVEIAEVLPLDKYRENYPYDMVWMAKEEDEAFAEKLVRKYDGNMTELPMIRVTTYYGAQHIGVSASEYEKLTGKDVNLSEREILVGIEDSEYQKEKKITDEDYLNTYSFLFTGKYQEDMAEISHTDPQYLYDIKDIFTQNVIGQYSTDQWHENIIVFSDTYFQKQWEAMRGDDQEATVLRLFTFSGKRKENAWKELSEYQKECGVKNDSDTRMESYLYGTEEYLIGQKMRVLFSLSSKLFLMMALFISAFFVNGIKILSELSGYERRYEFLRCMGMKQKQRRKTIRFETQMLSDIALFATVMMGIVYVLSYEWRCASKDAGSLDVTFWMYWILIVGIYLLADRLVQWLFAQYVIKRVEKGND